MAYDKITLGAFIDLEGAFNKVTFRAINAALRRFHVDRTLIRWIMAMLSNRLLSVDLFGVIRTGLVDRGCPQGGVLPPILWNITVDDLLTKLNGAGCIAVGFADDIALLISGAFEEILGQLMQRIFKLVEEWCAGTGLSVNPDKTGLVLFTKRRITAFSEPRLFGKQLTRNKVVKYLGVIIDEKLTWREHIQERVNKAIKVFWRCRNAFGKNWGLKPSVLYWMYGAIVRPILCYGSMLWSHCAKIASVEKKLTKVQRLACLSVTGVMTSTPTAALEVLLSLSPIGLFVEEQARLTVARLYRNGHWEATGRSMGHAGILDDLVGEFREIKMPSDHMETVFCFDRNFKTVVPTRAEWVESRCPVQGSVTVFTDGSKTDEGTGLGIYCEEQRIAVSAPLGISTTVFQSEITAISKSCRIMTGRALEGERVVICSDSESAIKALSSCKVSAKSVLRCRENLETLAESNLVTLVWVPGHSSIEGNEKADELARKGSEKGALGPEPTIGLHAGSVKALLKRKTEEEHQKAWEGLQTCRQAKEFLVGCKLSTTKYLLGLDKKSIRTMVGVLTGHNSLRYHLNKMGLSNDPNCRRCGDVPETAKHFLCHCPALYRLRTKWLGDFYITLEEFQQIPLTNVLSFITESKWLSA
jgi:ribonuclease HI